MGYRPSAAVRGGQPKYKTWNWNDFDGYSMPEATVENREDLISYYYSQGMPLQAAAMAADSATDQPVGGNTGDRPSCAEKNAENRERYKKYANQDWDADKTGERHRAGLANRSAKKSGTITAGDAWK